MISHSFTLEDYGQALRMFRAGQGRKLQVQPNQDTSQTLPGQADQRRYADPVAYHNSPRPSDLVFYPQHSCSSASSICS